MLGPEAELDYDIRPQESMTNRRHTPQSPLVETLADYATRQPEVEKESRAERERNRGGDGVFEGVA